jgi:GT2 family glycosyltransferase
MTIWICIPVFNRIQYTINFISTIETQTYKNFKIVICDHGSTDNTSLRIKQNYPNIILLNADANLWWTGAMNRCIEYVLNNAESNDYVLTLNNDTELPIDYLERLVTRTKKYPNAVVTSVIHDIDNKNLVSVGYRQNWLTAKATPVTFETDHITDDENLIQITHASGRGTLFPLAVFQELGLYDENHLPHYGADYDFSHKARRAGFPIYVCNHCKVYSYVDATGMSSVRNRFSLNSFINYFTSTKSPANLKARWWVGWHNCPKFLFPSYIILDTLRIVGSYFRHFIRGSI